MYSIKNSLSVCLTLLCIGCNQNDNDKGSPTPQIAGTWSYCDNDFEGRPSDQSALTLRIFDKGVYSVVTTTYQVANCADSQTVGIDTQIDFSGPLPVLIGSAGTGEVHSSEGMYELGQTIVLDSGEEVVELNYFQNAIADGSPCYTHVVISGDSLFFAESCDPELPEDQITINYEKEYRRVKEAESE